MAQELVWRLLPEHFLCVRECCITAFEQRFLSLTVQIKLNSDEQSGDWSRKLCGGIGWNETIGVIDTVFAVCFEFGFFGIVQKHHRYEITLMCSNNFV